MTKTRDLADLGGGFIQAGGGEQRTVESKLQDMVSVLDFGADPTGVNDSTAAIENAINNSHRKAVYFPRGIYKVTDTLNITVLSYSLVGERTERGQSTQFYRGGEYSAVRINFDPVDKTKFLVNIFQATPAINIIGPFEHKNLCFTLNGANGFQFGSETLTIDDEPSPTGQAYVHGVRFDNCNFESTGGVYGSDVDGTIALPNRRFIGLAKSFESVVIDCSFAGGDYGVRTLGCDKFNLTRCRLRCTRPLDFNSALTFTVQHTVTDFQCEGWLISPIRNNGVELAVHNSRLELNTSPPQGKGRYVLPTCTATVTANSNTLTFSRSMDNILIPGWSIIELSGGAETETCFVTAVNGATVTVSTDCFRFTWSGTATTVTRIHAFGPLHAEGEFGSYYTNMSAGSALDCPAFVYVGGRGSMYLTNCFAEAGYYGNAVCAAIGNRVSKAQFDMNGQMVLNSCTALLTPTVPNPLIRIINWGESLGENTSSGIRFPGADTFDSLKKIERKWIYTPARYSTNANNNHFTTFKKVAGDAGTGQVVYAWFAESSNPYGLNLDIYDSSLPSTSSGGLKFLIRAKAVSGGTTLDLTAGSNLGGANIGQPINLSTEWKTYTLVSPVPTQWGAGGTSQRLLRLTPSANVYIAGVAVIDENAQSDNTFSSNGIQKTTAHKAVSLTTGSGVIIARGSGLRESYKVKAYGWNTGANGGYATVYAEYIIQANSFSGTYAVRGVSQAYKQKQSIDNTVIDLDVAITAAIVSSKVEITATATLTGSAGDTTSYFIFDIEALSEPSLSMTLIPT